MTTILDRIKHGWNAFANPDRVSILGMGSTSRPDRPRLSRTSAKSFVNPIYTRIGIDVAAIGIEHVRLDEEKRYLETISSGLNECLTVAANIDQTGRQLIQDAVMSMCDEGAVAIVPIDTTINPKTGSYDIQSMRVGKILEWFPRHVRLDVYNERTGQHEQITLPKSQVALIENPLSAVMNQPLSVLQRLLTALDTLDAIDTQSASGKLDLIIQLPYAIKSLAMQKKAQLRRQEIEEQLSGSQYGIAYTDGVERITQLNRPATNSQMDRVNYLTGMLYGQLGLSEDLVKGKGSEEDMVNYYNRTIEPILAAVVGAMHRTFLTKTARSQRQAIMAFRDPFRLLLISQIGDLADKLTRNAILSSNEMRHILGKKPSKDPTADKLVNKNLNQPTEPDESQDLVKMEGELEDV